MNNYNDFARVLSDLNRYNFSSKISYKPAPVEQIKINKNDIYKALKEAIPIMDKDVLYIIRESVVRITGLDIGRIHNAFQRLVIDGVLETRDNIRPQDNRKSWYPTSWHIRRR